MKINNVLVEMIYIMIMAMMINADHGNVDDLYNDDDGDDTMIMNTVH